MPFFVYRHQIQFDDTMAYGSHHFLTNFKFQCKAREAILFAADGDGVDRWAEPLSKVELLTQQGYARNLNPAQLGDRVAVLMSGDELGYGSFRLCFRVVDAAGRPVTCGYQNIVIRDKASGQVGAVPEFLRDRYALIREPFAGDFTRAVHEGGKALAEIFPESLCAAAAALASGRAPLPDPPYVQLDEEARGGERRILVCPGQGSYDKKLLEEGAERLPWFRSLVSEVETLCRKRLGFDVALSTLEDANDARRRIYREQLGILLGAILCGRLILEKVGEPAAIVGHSVGEIAALVLAQALTPIQGATVVLERTRALIDCAPPGGLIAVEASKEEVAPLLAGGKAGCLAVVNHRRQSVIAGTEEQLAAFDSAAKDVRRTRIAAPFPFHSPLLAPAVQPFVEALADLEWTAPQRIFRSPMERSAWRAEWHLPTLLASHLIRPLDFAAFIAESSQYGVVHFTECSRRGVVTRIIEQILGPTSRSRAEATALDWPRFSAENGKHGGAEKVPEGAEEALRTEEAAVPAVDEVGGGFSPVAVVGWGVCLPGAPNVESYARLLQSGASAIRDRRELDPTFAADFLGPEETTPDRTYTLLGGLVEPIPPIPERFTSFSGKWTRVQQAAANALDECIRSLRVPAPERRHVVVGSTADGCDAFDDAVALERLQREGLIEESVAAAGRRSLGGAAVDLDHHRTFLELTRTALGASAETTIVDAACASSLYAVDLAARLLAADEADVVFAGGAFAPGLSNNCLFAQFRGLSSTGSRPLDARADGVVFGEGAAFLAFKRLDRAVADGDAVLGVVRGTGMSSDGRSASVSKPSAEGQELAMRRAYAVAGVEPKHVQFVEAHATGTPVGDRTEFTALARFFSAAPVGSIGLASVKSQIGHTGWVAGAASLIRVLIAMAHNQLPAQPGFQSTNLPLADSPFQLSPSSRPWNATARRRIAGVNSFGFGGANSHVVLESFDPSVPVRANSGSNRARPIALCAERQVVVALEELEALRNGLRKGKSLMPDVIDSMDPSQVLAVNLTGSLFEALPSPWNRNGEQIGVVLYMPGKTGAIVHANDRVLIRRMSRLVSAWGGRLDAVEALRRLNAETPTGPYTLTGGMPNITSARVCQVYNLKGPNVLVAESSRGREAARFYAQSLVGDGTCDAVVLLEIEPKCEAWAPREYRASARLIASAAHATKVGWLKPEAAATDAGGPFSPPLRAKVGLDERQVGNGTATHKNRKSQRSATPVPRSASSATSSGFDASTPIGFYRVELTPWTGFLPVDASSVRLLLLADERTRRRIASRAIPGAWRIAGVEDVSEVSWDRWDGVVVVSSLAGGDDRDYLGGPDEWRSSLGPVLEISRAQYDAIGAGRLKLAHISLDAFRDRLPHPLTGLVGGFVKSLGRELPSASIAAVACDDENLPSALTTINGMWNVGRQTWEAFRIGGVVHRHVLAESTNPADDSQSPLLNRGDLAIVTGGARGVTAELVAMLLERYACRVMLLGRSDPDDVPEEWRALDAEELAAKLPQFLRNQTSQGSNLRAARSAFERLQAAHEASLNLARFGRLPGLVEYHCCDATNEKQVLASLRTIQTKHGPVRFVLHGAGVQVSGRLDRKDLATFWRIIDTKLAGLRAVLRAIAEVGGPAPHVHIATSAFSYFGNDGQEDYGAANEMLNRLVDLQMRRAGASGATWTTMAWLAWDGIGMTKGSEYRALARERRMRGIGGPEGGELLARLLAGRPCHGANILMTENEREQFQIEVVSAPERVDDWRLNEAGQHWLNDHQVNGRPVYPACVLVARMAAAAQALRKNAVAVAVEKCRFERPLAARIGRARVCARSVRGDASSIEVWVEADLNSPGGRGLRFASCIVRFEGAEPSRTIERPTTARRGGEDVRDPYCQADSPVRLGRSFDCLHGIRLSSSGNSAVLRPPVDRPAALWQTTPQPLLMDALIRLGSLHRAAEGMPVYVPARIDRIAWNAQGPTSASASFELEAATPEADGGGIHCAWAYARDLAGDVVLEVYGYRGVRLGRIANAELERAAAAR